MEIKQRQIELRGGRIILHTRADDRHGFWQCRLRLGPDRKLIRRSTRTANIEEAKRTAEEFYDELRYRHLNQKSLTAVTFKQVAADFLKTVDRDTVEGRLGTGRQSLITGTVERYLIPFFGKYNITEITTAHFTEYDDWRLDYWTVGYGANRTNAYNKAINPSAKTLLMEQGILRQLFNSAVEQGVLEHVPFMKSKRAKTNRRSAFGLQEYKHLMRCARRRITQTKNARIKRHRQLLEIFVRLLVNTGMRVGEARGLTWGDIEFINAGNGRAREVLRLWVDGKTGKRAIIGTVAAKIAIKKLLRYYGYENLKEARETGHNLFLKANGDNIKTFEISYRSLLGSAGLAVDRYGQKRTQYCLRHTYATFRLLYGTANIYLLAKNMGTSVAMIEQHYGHVTTTLAADKLV